MSTLLAEELYNPLPSQNIFFSAKLIVLQSSVNFESLEKLSASTSIVIARLF